MTATPKHPRPKRPGALLAALVLLLAMPALLSTPALAQGGKDAAPADGHGKITAVSATSITVTPPKGPARTYTINAHTRVRVNGQPATVADLNTTSNEYARIQSNDGVTARRILANVRIVRKSSFHAPAR